MTSTNYYKQSIFDHASLSIAVSFMLDENQNSNANSSLLNYIRKSFEFVTLRSPLNNSDNKLRKIYFNFKQDYSFKEKEWENFQAHHKPFGYLCVSEFKSGNDLKKILDFYTLEKEKFGTSIYDSRLVFIFNENTKTMCNYIKQTLNTNAEIMSSVDSETGEVVQTDSSCKEFSEELGYIQEYFVQNELIWRCKSVSRMNSSNSLNESTSSSYSNNWKICSLSSESALPSSPLINSPMKSFETGLFEEQSFEFEMHNFLKNIFEKLFLSLASRETVLMNKLEQTRAKHANGEANSDSGSVLSLDDTEFVLLDPLDQDSKKNLDENRFNKTSRSKLFLGRLNKQTADLSLMCGNYFESYYYYQLAVCYLRKANDQLWLAGAEEGLCCAWIIYCFQTPTQALDSLLVISLNDKSRQLFSNQLKNDQTTSYFSANSNVNSPDIQDFSFLKKFQFNDLFKNPPEIQSLDELYDKYHSSISKYKKILINKLQNVYTINFDSIIKASRFFVDQHRFLQAANFLKMIKNDLLKIQNDKEQYHNTLAQLYSQMGFFRKSALHKYKKTLLMHSKINNLKISNRQQVYEQKITVLIEILNDLNLKINDLFPDKVSESWLNLINDGLSNNGNNKGFQSIKFQIILELYNSCKSLNYPINTLLALGLSILDNWYHLITKDEYERLLKELDTLSKSGIGKENPINFNVSVMNLPRLKKVILNKLPDYLLPKQPSKLSDEKSVFIYTPIKAGCQYGRESIPEPILWVCGDECEIVLIFDNLINIPLQLSNVEFLLTNTETGSQTWIPSEGNSIHSLDPLTLKIYCHFVIVPNNQTLPMGSYRVSSVSYHLISILSITFHPNKLVADDVFQSSLIPEIKLYPMMPQLRILSSINDQSNNSIFKLCKSPSSTVSCSSLDLFVNEIFDFSLILSNESNELDIDHIVCLLDELDLNITSNTLISRLLVDEEFSNRKCSPHKLLSFSSNFLEKCLPVKSISSLKDTSKMNADNPSPPTDVILKFHIDTTNNEFCGELFEKSLTVDTEHFDVLWRGQLKITFHYWSNRTVNCEFSDNLSLSSDIDDVVIVKNENLGFSNTYRESTCLINCQLLVALGIISYYVDNQLNLVLSLMNFTENKMNVELLWNDVKIQKGYVTIAPNQIRSNLLSDSKRKERNSSTELFSNVCNLTVSHELLMLKSLMKCGSIKSEQDLVDHIQKNLKISWIMKDKALDKVRQGFVNLSWCNCDFSKIYFQNFYTNEKSLGHQISFSANDLIRIWMWDNVKLELVLSKNNQIQPTLPDNTGETIHIFEGLEYAISCSFKEEWPSFICDSSIAFIKLLPCVLSNSLSTPSLSSSESDNGRLKRFIFSGNTMYYLQKNSFPNTKLTGFILFLQPGNYSVNCHLIMSDNDIDSHKWQTDITVLAESEKHQVHVT